jgi:hypothetical protein
MPRGKLAAAQTRRQMRRAQLRHGYWMIVLAVTVLLPSQVAAQHRNGRPEIQPPPRPAGRQARSARTRRTSDPYAGWISVEPRRWPALPWPPRTGAAARPTEDAISACIARLDAAGIETSMAIRRAAAGGVGCAIATPVRLTAVRARRPMPPVTIAGAPEVDCAMAERFGTFTREILAPLASTYMSSPLTAIAAGGFACRSVDGVSGAAPSPHATGIAIDVMGFTFADGRHLTVGAGGSVDADAFFKALRTAACGYFTTVLGPGSDAFHANHLHLDLKLHGNNDRYRICQ